MTVFGPEATAPKNRRLLVFGHMPAGHEEMAMGWKDVLDDRWYFVPQGGLIPFTVEQWCEGPQPPEWTNDPLAVAPVPDMAGAAEIAEAEPHG